MVAFLKISVIIFSLLTNNTIRLSRKKLSLSWQKYTQKVRRLYSNVLCALFPRSTVCTVPVRDGGGKSFSNKKCEKRAGAAAATAPFPKSCASYFCFARFNTFPLYYLRAWHRHLYCSISIIFYAFKPLPGACHFAKPAGQILGELSK